MISGSNYSIHFKRGSLRFSKSYEESQCLGLGSRFSKKRFMISFFWKQAEQQQATKAKQIAFILFFTYGLVK